ncbi:GNAT family N-acetyltransferase [Qipengyuania huizhouensis]|uniref:GNAT family N-acetyltransferase n=1 Tax=Qipengyuania huizhouensis TaxID=2867245 RepID=UPI001C88D7F1|nr:GNAT family N-acetyltransferase [Qipengyuania huizhouensis]MBX7461098.1 GNAT family N-acetyltransferase [Qipengyuania huizhouensis]
MEIREASLDDEEVRALIAFHQQDMEEMSPPGTSYALDLSGLSGPEITVLGAWEGDTLIAIGALKRLDEQSAELKSMRTLPTHLGKGAARAILEGLIALSRNEGFLRLSLETGTSVEFLPAITLYERHGFARGEAFADYANGSHNQCYHLDLQAPREGS